MMTNRLRLLVKQKSKDDTDKIGKDKPEMQKVAIKHCMNGISYQVEGMRYDHKWVLFCVLLRIKSCRTYDHLETINFCHCL